MCSSDLATATTTVAPESTFRDTVPARPGLVSVKDMGPIRQNPRVGGRDGGQSTLYQGKSVWIFNDTTLQNPWGFLSNSAAMTTDLNASDGIDLRSSNGFTINNTETPLETVPRTETELAFEKAHRPAAGKDCKGSSDEHCGAIFGFWPGPIISDPARDRVLFTYGKLCRGGQAGTFCSGPMGKGLGMGIAAIDMTTGKVTRLTATGRTAPTGPDGRDETMFSGDKATAGGGAALTVGDNAYLYGKCDYFDCVVARVALKDIADVSKWTWFDGAKFVSDHTAAKKTGAQPGAAGNTVFYSPAMKAYVDVYMPYGSNEIWYRVGGSPMGPWGDGVKLLKTEGSTTQPNYAMYGHAEFAEKNGLVQYLSYFNGKTGAQHLVRWEATA